MLGSLFARKPQMAATMPDNVCVYAIGDIHGCSDLADAMLDEICRDPHAHSCELHLVTLGDYVDRGPDSRGVLDILIHLKSCGDVATHLLLGNHEKSLLDFLDDSTVGPLWAENGGRETLMSYGVEPPWLANDEAGWEDARIAFAYSLPEAHLAFLRSLSLSCSIGGYFFVHAGVKPGVPLDAQEASDLLWIRRSFLDSRQQHERVIVHGHTPTLHPYKDERRVGVDTGAYASGVLTAVRLEGAERRFFQVRRGPGGFEAASSDRRPVFR